jgi:hypothetical protein
MKIAVRFADGRTEEISGLPESATVRLQVPRTDGFVGGNDPVSGQLANWRVIELNGLGGECVSVTFSERATPAPVEPPPRYKTIEHDQNIYGFGANGERFVHVRRPPLRVRVLDTEPEPAPPAKAKPKRKAKT